MQRYKWCTEDTWKWEMRDFNHGYTQWKTLVL